MDSARLQHRILSQSAEGNGIKARSAQPDFDRPYRYQVRSERADNGDNWQASRELQPRALATTCNREGRSLSHAAHPQARFIVRQGGKGWMVYDRERKGPALLKDGGLAEKLTREQAEQVKLLLSNLPEY
jgi:hypothetical protein